MGIAYLLTFFVDFHGNSMRIWDICLHLVDCDSKSVGGRYSSPIDPFRGIYSNAPTVCVFGCIKVQSRETYII